MSKIIDINRRRRPKSKMPPKSLLRAQIASLTAECAESHRIARGFAARVCEAGRDRADRAPGRVESIALFLTHELDLTAHNLRVVLICALCLFDKYTAESAA